MPTNMFFAENPLYKKKIIHISVTILCQRKYHVFLRIFYFLSVFHNQGTYHLVDILFLS